MAELKSVAKDTAIYGLSSIIGKFLNYLLVPLYTAKMTVESGGYGIVTNIYAYVALLMVILTFGMETTLFRFANKEGENPQTVYGTTLTMVGSLSLLFALLVLAFLHPIASSIGYADHPEYVGIMAVTVALDAFQAIPFAWLRYQHRPIKFFALKMLFIVLNITLNILYFVVLPALYVRHAWVGAIYNPSVGPGYAFILNLVCTSFITFFFIPELTGFKYRFDTRLMKRMLGYSWPILILGIAGILNQTADKIIFPLVYGDTEAAKSELGIYGACVKIAMIMAMITQAFRLSVVPIVMAAEIMMGVYFNLSFWYKLIDKTIWGAWFSAAGCLVLFAVNIIFIPTYSYMACAWGGFAGYATAMLLSYIVGQKKNPVRYPLKSIGIYVLIAGGFYAIMACTPEEWPVWTRLGINTVLILLFVGHILKHDLPVRSLPVIGKYFRKFQK